MKEAIPGAGAGPVQYNINKYIDARLFEPSTGLFSHPDEQKQMTLKELMIRGHLDPYATRIIDRANNKELRLLDAIQEHIVS